MKKLVLATIVSFFLFSCEFLFSQEVPLHPSVTGAGRFLGITPPLRDLPVLNDADYAAIKKLADEKVKHAEQEKRSYPYADIALPKGPDPVWQRDMGKNHLSRAPIANFNGQTSPYYPPDANGTAGPNHYMQTINCVYAIYNKSGTLVSGPTNMNLLFGNVTGATYNDGDPLVLYDEQADRWLAVEFSISGSNDYMLIAVSTTNDPTGTWYKYSFDVADMPDYEKFGIWQDGYYMGDNNSGANDIYVFERSAMLTGAASPKMVGFTNAWRPTTVDGFMCVPPVDNDGAFAPAGSPGLFITINDDAVGGGSDQLWIYELAVNWTTTTSSTFTRSQQLSVPAFNSNFGSNWDNISQPTSQKLDAIPMVIMNVPQYRNFGSYQTLVCCHTVNLDGNNHAGIRWYELRRTTGSAWSIRQSGTYGPTTDSESRWMGSVMLNGSGQIALGYSVSGTSTYPSIRYCGQSATAYANATGILDIPEESIQVGANAQSSYNRWGDYALMSVDPSDDKTFWFTTEYLGSGGTRNTKIASFKFSNSPTVSTTAATSVTTTTATINGSINPNGLSSTYYFQWGTTTSYGTTTATTSAGSGSTNVNVNVNLTGLTAGTTYHYRLVGVNSDGTTNGTDMTFTPGAAVLSTTAATSITTSTAVTGGNITSDGGFAVTARGVCWATTANPVVTGSHTTDGTGAGVFISTLTGLSAVTTYHIRAYATTSAGTFYGNDLTFTTTCGLVASFPWTEGFENAGAIPSCWTQEQVSSSGINWTFITGSGNSHPSAAHGGTYNACLKDATAADNKTKLVSPPINLASLSSPTLKFWHTQAVWSGDQDQLAVYYRTSATGTWTLITTYTASITAWTQETISLPSPSAEYYIAFEGNAKYGYGVCVDDVQVSSTCVTTLPVSLSIAASANPVCQGTSVTCTATPANGGTTPAYQWKVNGTNVGTSIPTYSYTPAAGDLVTCVLTSNATCISGNPATSNTVTMTVNAVTAAGISVAASANPACSGTSVNFTATPVNGGTTPAYQWKVNGSAVSGATASSYSFAPANGNTVQCVLTSNAACVTGSPASSNTVTMTVNPVSQVGISITPSAGSVCSGTPVTFTATPVNGGTTPAYQWKVNGNVVTGATALTYAYTPLNNDNVVCTLTSNIACATGNPATSAPVVMTVTPTVAASLTITGSANNFCAGNGVTYTASPVNGGASPSFQWKINGVNAGGDSLKFTFIPTDGNIVTCRMTASGSCITGNPANSNADTMHVKPAMPVSVSLNVSSNPVCEEYQVTYTTTTVNGGTAPYYSWTVNGIPQVMHMPFLDIYPVNNDEVRCIFTSSETCATGNPATSDPVVMSVLPFAYAGITISPSANPVLTGTPVTFTAVAVNGGTTPVYQWKVNGINAGTSNVVYSYIPADGDAVTCTLLSDYLCTYGNPATSNVISMQVTPVAPIVEVKNDTVTGTECFNAYQTLLVAGDGSSFTVRPGGIVTMIAGKNIIYYPGTVVDSGGYMYGYIAPGGPWCFNQSIPQVTGGNTETANLIGNRFFSVYPNPTTDLFTLTLTSTENPGKSLIEIFGMKGEKIMTKELNNETSHEFSLVGNPPGIYLVRVLTEKKSGTMRIVKQLR